MERTGPSGSVRSGGPADARAVAEVHVAGWQHGYRDLFPRAYLDALDVDDHERRWAGLLAGAGTGAVQVLVHEDEDGRVDAFARCGPAHDDDVPASAGEVYALYVRPTAWQRGVGSALLAAAAALLGRPGGGEPAGGGGRDRAAPVLWTMDRNRRARRFYAQQGWAQDGAVRRGQRPALGDVPGVAFTEVRYRLTG